MPSVTLPPVRALASYAMTALLLLVAAVPVLAPRAAHAAERRIQITADGPIPAIATIKAGDTVIFRNADPTFVHQVDEASPNWSFTCPPLAPGAECNVGTLTKPGEYLYEGINLDDFTGKVVIPAPSSPAASPTRPRPASSPAAPPPQPASSPEPGQSPAAEPSPTGGTGAVGPPLIGGGLPSLAPSPGGPAPDIAPALPGEEPSPEPTSTDPAVLASPGRLPEPVTARRYGLPAALAAVAAAGVGSLLVRLLLAHPAARARRPDASGPPVTVD